jgi:glycosyltransferase involved in cell wall biosynthesis
MEGYKASCIMPTANRELYVPLAIDYFLNQEFRNAELIIIDDGKMPVKHLIPDHRRIKYHYVSNIGNIGAKRNFACQMAKGEIIVHWDDDDWYGYEWISRQIKALERSEADICGLNEIYYYSPLVQKYWKYTDKNLDRPWLSGATFAYRRSFWEKHAFKDIQIGEDYDFIWNTGARLFAHDYTDGFYATLHARNTTLKPFENAKHKRHAVQWMDVQYEPDKFLYNLK